MNDYAKLGVIAVAGMAAVSMSAQAQTAVGGSAELLFNKTAAELPDTSPKCDITLSEDELPLDDKYLGEYGELSVSEDGNHRINLTLDMVDVTKIKILPMTKHITESFPNDGVKQHPFNEFSVMDVGIQPGAFFDHAKSYSYASDLENPFGINIVDAHDQFVSYTGTGEFSVGTIRYSFDESESKIVDRISPDSTLTAEIGIICYTD